jgi:putative heme-binding domain-containing protein
VPGSRLWKAALAALLGGLAATCAAPSDGPPEVVEPFDGVSLAGWTGDVRYWRAEGGALVGESTPDVPCEATTYLTWTGGELADFELELEVRLAGGNSGVQVRSQGAGGFDVTGYQVDLDAANEWTGGIYEQGGRGVMVRRGERATFAADVAAAREPLAQSAAELPGLRAGDWSRVRIVAEGPRLQAFLDGVPTSELLDLDPARRRDSGNLALQLHAGGPMRVEFRKLRLTRLASSGATIAEPKSTSAAPRWIWARGDPQEGERAWFFRELELESAPSSATLSGSCDNGMTVLLNGQAVLYGDDWSQPVRADVAKHLGPGRNLLAVAARNDRLTAGLQLALEWTDADGAPHRIVTDSDWHASTRRPRGWDGAEFDPRELPRAISLAPMDSGEWGQLPEAREAPIATALPASEVHVEPGYAVELVLSVPRALYGSWIALTIDEQGRAIAAAERGGLYRVALSASATAAPSIEVLDESLGGAQGLLARGSDLYVVAHESGARPSGLYRLRADEGGVYGAPELLRELDGAGEHGPHAVIADESAPGRLLLMAGNFTKLPSDLARSRVPRVWAEDQLLPRRDDPGKHDVGLLAPGGWVVSVDADGGDAELLVCGLRNAYDLAWGPCGELFTYDSDMEWDRGLAWYRPPRFLHLVDGADFGWRNGSGKWPADWPDSLPCVADTDLASPTGMLFGASLTAFGPRERAALLAADWAYGRILAVDLEPRGASFVGSVRTFASGRPLPVTDLAAGRDGCLYFVTGGRGAQSGLYRVRPIGGELASQSVAALGTGAAERATRRQLESARRQPGAAALAEAWNELGSEDPFLRHAARLVLENRPVEDWIERAQAESRPRALAQIVVALAHAGDSARVRSATELALRAPLEQLECGAIVDLLRALALIEMRLGGLPEPERSTLRARLEGIFPSGIARLDRELARMLVRLGSERVVAPALDLMQRASTSEEATHYAFALVEARSGWTDTQRKRFLDWLDGTAAQFEGGASFGGFMEGLRKDAWSRLGSGLERAAISASSNAIPVPARHFVRAWTVADLSADLGRVQAARSFERGRDAYAAALCASCHAIGGLGASTGPDLTGAGARFQPAEVLESIVEPSRVQSDQYRSTEVFTTDGELYVGHVSAERDGGVQLRLLPPDERDVWIDGGAIELRRLHPLSPMPTGLVDVLEHDEILDLVAYVLSGADPRDARFR